MVVEGIVVEVAFVAAVGSVAELAEALEVLQRQHSTEAAAGLAAY